jgi:UDP-glucose 4-epimerase
MRVYITGIAGFIGSHLAKHLKAQGHVVGGCDNLLFGNPDNLDATDIAWSRKDVLHMHRPGLDWFGPDVVVHLAAVSCSRHPNEALIWQNNLWATAHLMSVAKRHRIIFASTCLADKPETGAYADSKRACEKILSPNGAAILRLANVYGPRQRDWGTEPSAMAAWRKAEAEGKPIRIDGDGTQTRDFIHVDDVVRAFSLAIEREEADGHTVDICTGVQTPIIEAARAFRGPRDYGSRPNNDPDHTAQDPELADRLLGFRAEIPLHQLSEAA